MSDPAWGYVAEDIGGKCPTGNYLVLAAAIRGHSTIKKGAQWLERCAIACSRRAKNRTPYADPPPKQKARIVLWRMEQTLVQESSKDHHEHVIAGPPPR